MLRTLLAAALVMAALPVMAAEYPDKKQADIAKNGSYVGSDSCVTCHGDIHANWEKTRHTQKARKGPAMGKEFSAVSTNGYNVTGTSWTVT
jgi:mono/diheme cytochrome c family protein